ncbi:MAG TPA: bifunctional oligoribonuclease/PAP phosphatase NrnA [Solirubrobacteraceae bacterium]|nr:bifunctional oligoribonuclease/PAP phosphatase NrnA [Solirubrobacteraceae bacterium]
MGENGARGDRERVLEELRGAERFVVVTHENPDGDALGSLIAMQGLLAALGKDCKTFMAEGEFPLPQEYNFLPLENLVTSPPEDLAHRTCVFLDCGNLERNPAEAFQLPGAHILNIDHHHDNTRFGTVNLVVPDASCTAEIVWDLMHGLGLTPSRTVAEALYVGLITDTGRFMYQNTTARAHRMAAELIDAGVDVHHMYRRVYEGVPFGKLALLARGLARVERYDGGRLTMTELTTEDFEQSGAEESYSEGVIDHLRALEGTAVAALVRDRLASTDPDRLRKVSLRSSDERVDVSLIARAQGGGGHRQAAGFSTSLEWGELVAFLREAVDEQLAATAT